MGINDIAVVQQEEPEMGEDTMACGDTLEDKAPIVSKDKKKRPVKKTTASDNNPPDKVVSDPEDSTLGKKEKKNKKRPLVHLTTDKDEATDRKKTKSPKTKSTVNNASSSDDNKGGASGAEKKTTKAAIDKKMPQDKSSEYNDIDMSSKKKAGPSTSVAKACRPKQLAFIPFKNDTIPEAHVSLRQSEEETKDKKKATQKTNTLVISVISDINITLKPHESYLFKLNGYLQSTAKNLYITLCSEQSVSLQRDLCVLNWAMEYNDEQQELVVPLYNRGNKPQKIYSNEVIAVIRALSPEGKLLLKK